MGLVGRIALCDIADRRGLAWAGLGALLLVMLAGVATATEPKPTAPLRVGVYAVEPYGGQDRDGLFVGASVDLWRRVAEHLGWEYRLTLVPQMADLLAGVEAG